MLRKSKKYVLSLDEMDLGLLPTTYMKDYGKAVPLWTRSNSDIRSDKYYEFEIKTDAADVKERGHVFCHICAIEVPDGYLKQHIDSKKHEINIKIADIAMDRVKKAYHRYLVNDNNTDPTLYFCNACVVLVNKNERLKHEKSLLHRNSLIVDKFLYDFYLLYKNCDDDGINKNDLKDVDRIHVNENNNDISFETDVTCNKITDIDNSELGDIKKEDINIDKININSCNDISFDSDLTFMDNTDLAINNEKIEIIDRNLPKSENIETPNKENAKEKRKRGRRKNQIKNENTVSDDIDTNDQQIQKGIKSDDESRYDKTFYPNFTSHNEIATNELEINKNGDIYDENGRLHYHLNDNRHVLICIVCKIDLDIDNAIEHLNSSIHIDKYTDLLAEQLLMCNGDVTFCEVCGIELKKEEELIHCEKMTHITKHEMYKKRLTKELKYF